VPPRLRRRDSLTHIPEKSAGFREPLPRVICHNSRVGNVSCANGSASFCTLAPSSSLLPARCARSRLALLRERDVRRKRACKQHVARMRTGRSFDQLEPETILALSSKPQRRVATTHSVASACKSCHRGRLWASGPTPAMAFGMEGISKAIAKGLDTVAFAA